MSECASPSFAPAASCSPAALVHDSVFVATQWLFVHACMPSFASATSCASRWLFVQLAAFVHDSVFVATQWLFVHACMPSFASATSCASRIHSPSTPLHFIFQGLKCKFEAFELKFEGFEYTFEGFEHKSKQIEKRFSTPHKQKLCEVWREKRVCDTKTHTLRKFKISEPFTAQSYFKKYL
jgi:hypothetical protein